MGGSLKKQYLLLTLILLFLSIGVFLFSAGQLRAEILEDYKTEFFWKLDILQLGIGGMYSLDSNYFGIVYESSLLCISVIKPEWKVGVGFKTTSVITNNTDNIQMEFAPYFYYVPFMKVKDKIIYCRESGEAVLVERKAKPLYLYIGVSIVSTYYSEVIDFGICWAPISFMNIRLGCSASSRSIIYLLSEYTYGIGWKAKVK